MKDYGRPTCEDCGEVDGVEEYRLTIEDPDSQRDGGPRVRVQYAYLCPEHAERERDDPLTLHVGSA